MKKQIKFSNKKNKKAQGLSLNMIVVAVIALIVIVVMVIIFTGKSAFFSRSITACDQQPGAVCSKSTNCADETKDSYAYIDWNFKCTGTDKCCYSSCRAVGGQCTSEPCGTKENFGTSGCKGGKLCCK